MLTLPVDDARTDPPLPTWLQEPRHVNKIVGVEEELEDRDTWRKYSKERMKTVSVALVLCLNIGVDPPDVQKPKPCARMECWIDPQGMNPQKAIAKIAMNLQKNYERWQPRARYKNANDPTVDDVRRLCQSMRRNARDERVLFHYNGHGVPKPTDNGEVWVFNKNFTQYIPLSIFDLQTWMNNPSVYVWDCNCAGLIVRSFIRFSEDHEREWVKQLDEHMETRPPPLPVINAEMTLEEKAKAFGFRKKPNFKECIQLASCGENELLPMDPDLPADLFTSCLTTPIHMSVLWYIVNNGLKDRFPTSMIENIPGQLTDRRTLLGELNWIFTAITDTIAWNALPKDLFQKLFRQDLLLASLFRSFLLSDRIMRANHCHVVSNPALPSVHDHVLWDAWDYTLDLCLNQMQAQCLSKEKLWALGRELCFSRSSLRYSILVDGYTRTASHEEVIDPSHNWFFIEQLQAFEVWLKYGVEHSEPPYQLPVVLQVLLSQAHRVKALELLARFLDLGSWAVGHALSVGVFPYMVKLLQSPQKDLRPWLAFIWAKILAVEPSCQVELVKEEGYFYFIQILNDPNPDARSKIVPAFVTATLIENGYRPAQEHLTENRYVTLCIELLSDPDVCKCRLLRLWLLIGLGRLWADYDDARWQAVRLVAYERVLEFLDDTDPEVRAAAVYALGCLVRNRSENNDHAASIDHEVCDKLSAKCTFDGSVIVRAELVVAMQWFIIDFENRFANLSMELNKKIDSDSLNVGNNSRRKLSIGEQEMNRLLSIEEEDPYNRIGNTNSLQRVSHRRRGGNLDATQSPPKRSSSMIVDWNTVSDHDREVLDGFITAELSTVERIMWPKELIYKKKAMKQVRLLEAKTFKDQSERIWLSLLWLSLDPVTKIAEMAQVLIEHVEKLALSKREKLNSASRNPTVSKEADTNTVAPVTFTIGSPTTSVLSVSLEPKEINVISPETRRNRLSESRSGEESRSNRDLRKNSSNSSAMPIFHPSGVFTPKRSMYIPPIANAVESSGDGHKQLTAPLITTEFVPWCSKRFTEPILDVIQGQAGDGLSDRLAVMRRPSDWAYHKDEGLRQTAKHELSSIMNLAVHCNNRQMLAKCDRRTTALEWSLLRPHLYSCDGRHVNIWRYEAPNSLNVRRFDATDRNPYVDDVICNMQVMNEMTRELLLTGSRNGLVRVWDPCYSIHSYEFEGEPVMLTAAYLLKDIQRIGNLRTDLTLYCWAQPRGRIATSGNVRVCRLWDVHAERTIQDVDISTKGTYATALCTDDECSEMIAIGLNDGSINLYDPRIPSKGQRIMSFRDLDSPVVGLCLLNPTHRSGGPELRLVAGSEDGEVRVWEPRMFREPVVQFNACGLPRDKSAFMPIMQVQSHGQLIGCVTSASVIIIYDVSGKQLTEVHYGESFMGGRPAMPVAMRFHHLLVSFALTTEDNVLCSFGMPSS